MSTKSKFLFSGLALILMNSVAFGATDIQNDEESESSAKASSSNLQCQGQPNLSINFLHFSDVWDFMRSPYFASQFLAQEDVNKTILLFSGNILYSSYVSKTLKGAQFSEFLKKVNLDFALIGARDLDGGEDNFVNLTKGLSTKWLLANLKHKTSGEGIGKTLEVGTAVVGTAKVCLFGLVDLGYLLSLLIDTSQLTYEPFIDAARRLTKTLRQVQSCNLIVALTSMSEDSDTKLLEDPLSDIDLIFGGQQKVYLVKKRSKRVLVKSGENFINFSKISTRLQKNALSAQSKNSSTDANFDFRLQLTLAQTKNEKNQSFSFSLPRTDSCFLNVSLEKWAVDLSGSQDSFLKQYTKDLYNKQLVSKASPALTFDSDVDLRSSEISTKESGLGDFLSDLIRIYFNVNIGVVPGGVINSGQIFYSGAVFREFDAINLFVNPQPQAILTIPGGALKALLEFALQIWSKNGSFFNLGGVSFDYSPLNTPGNLITLSSIKINGLPLNTESSYSLSIPKFPLSLVQAFPILASLPINDPPNSPVDVLSVFSQFYALPRILDNRTEFRLFKLVYQSITIDFLSGIYSGPGSHNQSRLTPALVLSQGTLGALKALNLETIKRLKCYTLAKNLVWAGSTYVFSLSFVNQKRVNLKL